MRSISKKLELDHKASEIFNALIQPSAIQQWWQVKTAIVLPKKGGIWSAAWGENIDEADYIVSATISEFEVDSKLVLSNYVYDSKQGSLPFEFDPETTFEIGSLESNKSQLIVNQTGFPDSAVADEHFESCIVGWENTLQNLQEYLKK